MTDEIRLIAVAAAPTVAVLVAAFLDHLAHRKIDKVMADVHKLVQNGQALRKELHERGLKR